MSDAYRAFIALGLPQPVRDHLAAAQTCLADRGVRGRWVRPRGMHLTLKFLGPLRPAKVPAVVAALDPVAAACPPLALATAGLGAFPGHRRARVLWMGIGGESARLIQLQEEVDAALHPLAWPKEKRPFRGHLTLARAKGRGLFGDDIADRLAACEPGAALDFQADRLALYHSRLRPQGAVYEALHQWRL